MNLLQRIGAALRAPETKSAPATPVPGAFGLDWLLAANTASAQNVSAATAMRCAPYAAALRTYSDALATLPFKLMRRLPEGGKEPATDSRLYGLVHADANEWTSAGAFRASLIADAIQSGDGVGVVVRNGAGYPVELHRIDPAALTFERNTLTGEPAYKVSLADGGHQNYSFADVVHVTSPYRAPDGLTGLPFWVIAREAIGLSLVMESAAANIYSNSAAPSGTITVPGILGEETAQRMSSGWHASFGESKRGRVAVLEDGATYSPVQAQPLTDQQFLEMRGYQLAEIARVFGVPPHLIADLSRATWSNAAEMNRAFLQHSLLPWLVNFEAAYTRALLTTDERKEYAITAVTDGFTRASVGERASAYAQFRGAGVYSSNELRRLEGLPMHPEGDSLASPYTTSNDAPASSDKEPSE